MKSNFFILVLDKCHVFNSFWKLDYYLGHENFNQAYDYANYLLYANILLTYLFLFVLLVALLNSIIFFFWKSMFLSGFSSFKYVKYFGLSSYMITAFILIIYFNFYLHIISSLNTEYYNNSYTIVPYCNFFNIQITLDLFGIILLLIALFVGLFSFLALDNKLFWKRAKFIFYLNIFILIVFFYVTTNNILVLFLFYEFLLIPSFLLVYFLSPSRKAIQASLYFVIWTQIGSFLVLTAVFYIIMVTGTTSFFLIKNYNFSNIEAYLLYGILFFGFGFKIPIWPFHYWLTKTHVEAP